MKNKTGSNAPQMPTKTPMPKCKPPKDYWEIPSFMPKSKRCVLEELEPLTYDSTKITQTMITKRAREIFNRDFMDGDSYFKVTSLKMDIDRLCTYYAIKELKEQNEVER